MHLSPLLDHRSQVAPKTAPTACDGAAYRTALGRGVAVLAVFAGLLVLAEMPRFVHRSALATTIAGFAAWDAANHPAVSR